MREVGGVGNADRLHDGTAVAGADRRTRSGVSRPCSCRRSGSNASITSARARLVRIDHQDNAKSLRPRACADRARPRSRSAVARAFGVAHEADQIRTGLQGGVQRLRRGEPADLDERCDDFDLTLSDRALPDRHRRRPARARCTTTKTAVNDAGAKELPGRDVSGAQPIRPPHQHRGRQILERGADGLEYRDRLPDGGRPAAPAQIARSALHGCRISLPPRASATSPPSVLAAGCRYRPRPAGAPRRRLRAS